MLNENVLQRNRGPTQSTLGEQRIEMVGRDPPDLVDVPPEQRVVSAGGTQADLPQRFGVRQRCADRLPGLLFVISWHEHMFAHG